MGRGTTGWAAAAVALVLLVAGCSSDDGSGTGDTQAAAATTTTAAAIGSTDIDRAHDVIETLATDEFGGRNDGTEFHQLSEDYLTDQLSEFTQPLPGADGYRQEYPGGGVNLIGVIPGGELADEYVIVGAHYDHHGSDDDCIRLGPGDDICNGATDNAAGVAAALELGRSIAGDEEPPRRSVIIALWDQEEDGLRGSAAYVADPLVPLDATIAYVNFDIQGANLTPAGREFTVMVGAETGGPNLIDAARAATEASTLDTAAFSLLFGQGRSDHATFAAAGVPTVFFTDSNGPCWHTVGDEITIVDFPKLEQQIATGEALTRDLMATDAVPEFDPDAPPASFDDAVTMDDALHQLEPDFGRFSPDVEASIRQFETDLDAVVAAGEGQFDDAAVQALLGGSVELVQALATGDCDGFLE